jgi:tetratricopeptide (TPR) repeat protein
VVGQYDDRLDTMLDDLQLREFIYEQPAAGEAEYIFKHALTQEVAYNSVLLERRKLLHGRTAEALATLFSERLEDHLGEIAHHYRHSGNIEKAIYYLRRAGERAVDRWIYTEAITHFTTALELLKTLPNQQQRIEQELSLQIALGPPLMVITGFRDAQVEAVYRRALELCRLIGETHHLFRVLRGLWFVYIVRQEQESAREAAQQLIILSDHQHDDTLSMEANYAMGYSLLELGELAAAQMHFQRSIALYQYGSGDTLYGYSTRAASLADLALVSWFRGYADQALKQAHEALALARTLSHPNTLAIVFAWLAYVYQLRREEQAVREWADATIMLSSERGFLTTLSTGTMLRGWALASGGATDQGIEQMRNENEATDRRATPLDIFSCPAGRRPGEDRARGRGR